MALETAAKVISLSDDNHECLSYNRSCFETQCTAKSVQKRKDDVRDRTGDVTSDEI